MTDWADLLGLAGTGRTLVTHIYFDESEADVRAWVAGNISPESYGVVQAGSATVLFTGLLVEDDAMLFRLRWQ